MATTRSEIAHYLTDGLEKGYSHMIMACDTWNYEDYPVYVNPTEDIYATVEKYQNMEYTKVMEVYSYSLDLETQLNQNRAWNFETIEKSPDVELILRLDNNN